MKFAKELEQELVPEWRVKYLNYKAGKKYVKAVSRAINRANSTPTLRRSASLAARTPRQTPNSNIFAGSPFVAATKTRSRGTVPDADETASLRSSPAPVGQAGKRASAGRHQHQQQQQQQQQQPRFSSERQGLTEDHQDVTHYGSIISPSSHVRNQSTATDSSHLFELPAPALHEGPPGSAPNQPFGSVVRAFTSPITAAPAKFVSSKRTRARNQRSQSIAGSGPGPAFPDGDGLDDADDGGVGSSATGGGIFRTASRNSIASYIHDPTSPHQRLRRLFSMAAPGQHPYHRRRSQETSLSKDAIGLRMLDEVRDREQDFFRFLDGELEKVEGFYKLKEEQAGRRLQVLREQLHEMRNRRLHEIQAAKRQQKRYKDNGDTKNGGTILEENGNISPGGSNHYATAMNTEGGGENGYDAKRAPNGGWIAPIRATLFRPGPNSKALQKMPQTPRMVSGVFGGQEGGNDTGTRNGAPAAERRRDYTRRPADDDIPYRTAKHKLKLALQEFYRGLELLKSYAILNRTAFRKLNKKYDKSVHARPPYRYMNEKVNQSWFVNSSAVDDLIVAVEDLYARYFERGNHKIAAGKLRALTKRPGDESGSAFRSGLLIGIGAVFSIQGVVDGTRILLSRGLGDGDGDSDDSSDERRLQTSYLLQIYGGYFLMLYLFSLFCVSCRIWTRNKINYSFIFEFDPRSHIDWRRLSQFPSFFLLLFGLFIWLNFSSGVRDGLFLYFPVILIGISAVLLFLPLPTLWHRSRKWFLYSHWRLFFAGLYPVEFRDFFLGDMYCSLTYATCNVELFFCIYARQWDDPTQCNSNHSRLLGFFSTLPPIWRALQCIRRYYDTRNAFPHLANCGKYVTTIVSYVFLSLYRIENNHSNLSLFIAFSILNSLYTSIWDIFMDFSLLQADSRFFLLRDITALKSRWVYYVVMTLDPILRFSWIFYAIFAHNAQHSTIVSFLVSLAEVTRRGMWALLRVENEHCANVAQYKASRDVPLPYHLRDYDVDHDHAAGIDMGHADPITAGFAPLPSRQTNAEVALDVGLGLGRSTSVDGASTTALQPQHQQHQHHQHQRDPSQATTMTAPGGMATVAEEGQPGWGDSFTAAAAAAEEGTAGSSTLRRRRADTLSKKTIASMMAEAHKQDFEKKRQPADASPAMGPLHMNEASSDDDGDGGDDDDDDDDDDEVVDESEHSNRDGETAEHGQEHGHVDSDQKGELVMEEDVDRGTSSGDASGGSHKDVLL